MISTIEDLYHWEQALYTDQLAPRENIATMLSPQVSVPNSDGMSYGYGWFVGEVLGRTVQFHDGVVNGFYCTIIRYPDDQITLILLMNRFNVQRDTLFQVLMSKMFELN